MSHANQPCPDCTHEFDRRRFMRFVGGTALAASAAPLWGRLPSACAAPTATSAAETVVKRFYDSLSDKQKTVICFDFDHKLRKEVNANWHITDPVIGADFYNDDQRRLIDEIIRGVTSEDGYEVLQRQMRADARGVENYSVAVFGQPGSGKFQWELTGRHLTLRADGDSVDNAAFGGPIVYGHGASDPTKNLFFHQTQAANEVFKSLDADQAKLALLKDAPVEDAVDLQGAGGKFPGIAVADLSDDQLELVEVTFKKLLAPYRQEDVDETLAVLKAGGGLKSLHMAFYQEDDINDDKVWDIWRIEGPSVVWHFRAPHVHAYINIGRKQA